MKRVAPSYDIIRSGHETQLEYDSGYEGEPEIEDVTDFYDGTGSEHDLELDAISKYEGESESGGVFKELDDNHQGRKVYPKGAGFRGASTNQENKIQLYDKFYQKKDDGKKDRFHRQEKSPLVDQIQKENQVRPKYKASSEDNWHREVEVYEESEIYPEDEIRQEYKLLDEEEKQTKLWYGSDEATSLLSTTLPF